MYRILVVDDDPSVLKGIQFNLQENPDYEILTADNKETGLNVLKVRELDLVVSDLMVPEIEDGLDIMREAKAQWYNPSVIAMTAFETVENAVMTMQAGADDFLSKGFGVDELIFRIENILKKKSQLDRLAYENQILKETIQQHYSGFNIVGKSNHMQSLIERIGKVANDATVTCLIQGESGTGKDLVARTIHATSRRKQAPFVPINCAAIPENLIESELFGHEKGSFTGAIDSKPGKFEQARGGVIFLDEIGELPLPLQVRLLRVLEERNFYRIGGKHAIDIDVMIISATNKDLMQMVREGNFREDLYFRLNVINIQLPPLRDRKEDIVDLAHFFLARFNKERKRDLKFRKESLELLRSYDFPGNIRELRNIIEDAFVFCEGDWIEPKNLSLKLNQPQQAHVQDAIAGKIDKTQFYGLDYRKAMFDFEKAYFANIMNETSWNMSEVARHTGLSREWLTKKLKKLKLK